MGKPFDIHHEHTTTATPDQIWDAIATGPGISTWFIGHTRLHDDGTVHTQFGDDWIPTGTITTSNPPHHFAHATTPTDDGRFLAHEYLIEAADGSATVLRTATSGFLPGDDWADEYEAMGHGTALFLATLTDHLDHNPGSHTTPHTTIGPPVTDWPATWKALHHTLGIPDTPQPGDTTTDGGTVYHVNPHTLGIRHPHGYHRYIRGLHGTMIAAHTLHTPTTTDWPALLHTITT